MVSPPNNIAGKAKKSVALSGVTAGNTALSTVGVTGNDLHYRGYDILEIANTCEFEEIAFLLVHGKLPTRTELDGYKVKLKALRGLSAARGRASDGWAAHRMLRVGLCTAGEGRSQRRRRARDCRSAHCLLRLDAL